MPLYPKALAARGLNLERDAAHETGSTALLEGRRVLTLPNIATVADRVVLPVSILYASCRLAGRVRDPEARGNELLRDYKVNRGGTRERSAVESRRGEIRLEF